MTPAVKRQPLRSARRIFARALVAAAALALLLASGAVRGDTIILNDGTIIEGTIVRETDKRIKVQTKFGDKTFNRKDITSIIKESEEGSALQAMKTIEDFNQLEAVAKELKNAEALYKLNRFDEIPARVEPLIGKGSQSDDMFIRWLLIDNFERQGKWEKAEELLNKTLEDGRPPDKIRAQAHLDLFKENPAYNLRYVNKKRAKEFLEDDMFREAKVPNSLQNPAIMRAALMERLHQLLRDEKVSVAALQKKMKPDETLKAIEKAMEAKMRTASMWESLPYLKDLEAVEQSLYKAAAIMPGAARGFALDLVRKEASHLNRVLREMLDRVERAYPGENDVPKATEEGRWSKADRERWRKRCDEFLAVSEPVTELIKYLLRRVGAYPEELHPFIQEWEDVLERIEQMQQNTKRNYDRANA